MEMGISDIGLAKICKRHNIPRPGLGYWGKEQVNLKSARTSAEGRRRPFHAKPCLRATLQPVINRTNPDVDLIFMN